MKSANQFAALAAGLLLFSAASCTMNQDIYIEETGSGKVIFDVELASYLTEVIEQLEMVLQSDKPLRDPGDPFFDTEAIATDFENRDNVNLLYLETPTANKLSGTVDFEDINHLFQDESSPGSRLIFFETTGNRSELKVILNRETVVALLSENPSFDNPLVENFGPAATIGLSDTDYLDMMEFALGTESRRGIQDSALNLNVHVAGRILEQSGGRLVDNSTVQYSVPLLSVLILDDALEYSLIYE